MCRVSAPNTLVLRAEKSHPVVVAQRRNSELAGGRSLVDIGVDRGIGEMALREGLVELNPDLASVVSELVHNHQLLTSTVYVPS